MDTLSQYRVLIKDILRRYAQYKPSYGEVEVELVFDEATDHYQVSYVGWNGWRRIHGMVLHLDIKDGKIWVQHDGTDYGIANDLPEAGVPTDRIVLAFKHPETRKLMEFSVS